MDKDTQDVGRVLTQRDICARLGISSMTLHRWIRKGHFPAPVRIGPNRVGTLESEYFSWLAARAAERDRAA